MKHNGITQCDNCGKVYLSKYLMLDTKTKDYFCPTCYRNKRAKEERDNNILVYLVIGTLLFILFFCIMGMIGD